MTDGDFERAAQSGAEFGVRHTNPAQRVRATENRRDSQEQGAKTYAVVTCAESGDLPGNAVDKMAEVHGNRTHRPPVLQTAQRF